MRALVTGGAGFVGTNLIKRLLSEGHEVISVDNYSTGKYKNQQNFKLLGKNLNNMKDNFFNIIVITKTIYQTYISKW